MSTSNNNDNYDKNNNNNKDSQLRRSGLHLLASNWQLQCDQWPEPPRELRKRDCHATVFWTDAKDDKTSKNSNNNRTSSIALIGGWVLGKATASVIILNDIFHQRSDETAQKWQNGPMLNAPRDRMGASICHKFVYVMGGCNNANTDLDTIERIPISKLSFQNKNTASWTLLTARLSEPRFLCTAVTVQDRFIVVMGGTNRHAVALSSVDIIDTDTMPQQPLATATNRNNHNLHHPDRHNTVVTVAAGPNLHIPRYHFGATVLDDQIWVVGGRDDHRTILNTVECLKYASLENSHNENSAKSIFSSNWNLRPELSLRAGRHGHGVVAAMGPRFLVVAGGWGIDAVHLLTSVELLDPQRCVVLDLPDCDNNNGQYGVTIKMVEMAHTNNPGVVTLLGGRRGRGDFLKSLPGINLTLKQLKEYASKTELELRQQPLLPCSVSPIPQQQQQQQQQQQRTPLQVQQLLQQRSRVESLSHSLVFFYLFHKEGNVPCLHHHQQQQQLLRTKTSSKKIQQLLVDQDPVNER